MEASPTSSLDTASPNLSNEKDSSNHQTVDDPSADLVLISFTHDARTLPVSEISYAHVPQQHFLLDLSHEEQSGGIAE